MMIQLSAEPIDTLLAEAGRFSTFGGRGFRLQVSSILSCGVEGCVKVAPVPKHVAWGHLG